MKNKVIFSVFNGSKLDNDNHKKVLNQLKSLSAKELNGKYKNQLEKSIILDASFTDAIKKVADHFKQESILLIDEVGNGRLLFNDGRLQKIGKIKQVDKSEALRYDDYSELNEKYFIFE
jgi:hypothetical protein